MTLEAPINMHYFQKMFDQMAAGKSFFVEEE